MSGASLVLAALLAQGPTDTGKKPPAEARPAPTAAGKGAGAPGGEGKAADAGKGGEAGRPEGAAPGKKVRNLTFGAMDVEGKLKNPQLLYFLNRIKLELDPSLPAKRSFMKELEKTAEDPNL